MRRAVIAAAVLAAVLAAAPAAVAKEITSARICGADGCVTTRDDTVLQGLMQGGPPSDPPAHPSGAIRVRARVTEPGGEVIAGIVSWWVPGTRLLAAEDGSWIALPADVVRVLAKVADHLRPYGPDRLGARFVGTSSHAAPPAPVQTGTTSDEGVDWLLFGGVGGLCLVAALTAAGLAVVRRRPGGATP
jgi:hypothetical protein